MKKLVITAIVISILLLNLFLINADTPTNPLTGYGTSSGATAFFEYLNHIIGPTLFSVVGDDRACSRTEDYEWHFNDGDVFSTYASTIGTDFNGHIVQDVRFDDCPDKIYALFNHGEVYHGVVETKDNLYAQCSNGPCHVQVYCCPNPEPTDNRCPTGETLVTKTCTPYQDMQNTFYMCPGETRIPYEFSSYKYCSLSESIMTCYYRDGSVCGSRNYSKSQYPNSCESYSYQGGKLYSSKATCQGELGKCITDLECPSGKTCSNGQCASCTPDCSGKTCGNDGCGGVCGTCDYSSNKICSNGQCISGTEPPTCSDGIKNSNEEGIDCGGSCTVCGTPTTDDLSQIITVSNIKLPSYPEWINPFQSPTQEKSFSVTLKNSADKVEVVNVEAGFYTYNYARDVAKLFSIYSSVAPQPITNCVGTEPFVKTMAVTLQAGETKTITIKISPINAYVTYPIGENYILDQIKLTSFLGVMAHAGENACCKKLPNFEGCATGTGGYIDSKYDPGYYTSDQSIYLTTSPITCNGAVYGKIDYKVIGKDTLSISKSYKDCIKYEFYMQNGTIDLNATKQYLDEVGSFEGLKKYSLTRDEIKSFPIQDLIASACLSSKECLDRENYSVSCIRLNKLKEEGLIGETEVTDMAQKAKLTFGGSVLGGGIALTVCAASAVAGPVAFIACGIGGAMIGAASGYGLTEIVGGAGDFFSKEDTLTKAIKSGDSTSYGICTAEPKTFNYCQYTQWAGFFTIPGTDKCLSGLIIILVGLGIIILLFKGGK